MKMEDFFSLGANGEVIEKHREQKSNFKLNQTDILMVIDVQPAYHHGCLDIVEQVVDKINKSKKPVIFFFVGKELDLDSLEQVQYYLLEHGLDQKKLNEIQFISKSYGYFRNWMDVHVSDEIVIRAIQEMTKNNLKDSREFCEYQWRNICGQKIPHNVKLTEENIFWPDFNTKLILNEKIKSIELIGGGRDECLKEIELLLLAHDKEVYVDEKLCYGVNYKPKNKVKAKL